MPDNPVSSSTPENYKPLTPDERGQWNGFASYMQKQNVGDSLDQNPELGHAYMANYANQNRDFSLTSDHVANIQQDHQNIRSGDSLGNLSGDQLSALRDKLHPAFMAQPLPAVSGNIDSKTATLFYPTANVTDSKGRQIGDHGTDIESYASKYLTTPGKNVPEPPPGKATAPENPDDKEALEWAQSYAASPKAKEREANFYQYPEYIQKQREAALQNVGFTETSGTKLVDGQIVPEGVTAYTNNDKFPNQVNVDTTQLDENKIGRGEAVSHELGHPTNANPNGNPALHLSDAESQYILNRQKNAKDTTSGPIIDSASHDANPSENMSDIQALRFMMNKKGIYDARKEDMTPEMLKKAKADPDIKNSFIGKRLFGKFKDQDLIDINNRVALGGQQPKFDENTA